MAYSDKEKEEIYKKALDVSKKKSVYFMEDVVAHLPVHRDTFYTWWPVNSDKHAAIKANLEENKVQTKLEIREKLAKGNKAAELIALYKLIATDTERKALSLNYHDHTTKGDKIKASNPIDYSQLSDKVLNEIKKASEPNEE